MGVNMPLAGPTLNPFAVREDLERNNTLRMAAWEAQRAEFLLSMGKFREADEHFKRSSVLLVMLKPNAGTQEALLETQRGPNELQYGVTTQRKRRTLIGGQFVQ